MVALFVTVAFVGSAAGLATAQTSAPPAAPADKMEAWLTRGSKPLTVSAPSAGGCRCWARALAPPSSPRTPSNHTFRSVSMTTSAARPDSTVTSGVEPASTRGRSRPVGAEAETSRIPSPCHVAPGPRGRTDGAIRTQSPEGNPGQREATSCVDRRGANVGPWPPARSPATAASTRRRISGMAERYARQGFSRLKPEPLEPLAGAPPTSGSRTRARPVQRSRRTGRTSSSIPSAVPAQPHRLAPAPPTSRRRARAAQRRSEGEPSERPAQEGAPASPRHAFARRARGTRGPYGTTRLPRQAAEDAPRCPRG